MAWMARDGKRAGAGWRSSGIWWCARGRWWWRGANLPSRGRWYICRGGHREEREGVGPAELWAGTHARCSSMTSRQNFARPCIRCMIPVPERSLHGTHRPSFQKADRPPISARPAGPVPALRCTPSPNAFFLDLAHLDPCSSTLWLQPSHAQPQIRLRAPKSCCRRNCAPAELLIGLPELPLPSSVMPQPTTTTTTSPGAIERDSSCRWYRALTPSEARRSVFVENASGPLVKCVLVLKSLTSMLARNDPTHAYPITPPLGIV